MTANKYTSDVAYIVPLIGLKGMRPKEFLLGSFQFLTTEFVIRNALQMYVDFMSGGPDDNYWFTNAEENLYSEFGKYLDSVVGRTAFTGRNSRLDTKTKKELKGILMDEFVQTVMDHLSSVSTYFSTLSYIKSLDDLIFNSRAEEIIIEDAWIKGKNIWFTIEEY